MSDPSFATMQFAQQMVRPDLLTGIGQGLRGIQEQINTRDLEGQYNMALQQVYQNPTNDNISRLYQLSEPLGRFQNARAAVNDLFGRMPPEEVAAQTDPNMAAYLQAREAWLADTQNPQLQQAFISASQAVGKFDETIDYIDYVNTPIDAQSAWDEYTAAEQAFQANPTDQNYQKAVTAASRVPQEGFAANARLAMDAYRDEPQ
jgi:hypothetical protein